MICQTNRFKILTIRYLAVPYLFKNSIYRKGYMMLPHALPYAAHVKGYGKDMLTP